MLRRIAALCALAALPASASAATRAFDYCTQDGPLLMRFGDNGEHAAGLLTRLSDGSFTVFIGAEADGVFSGDWRTAQGQGRIELVFSEDYSTFEGRLIGERAANEDEIAEASAEGVKPLRGFLPPAGDPANFRIEGERYRCR